MTYHPNCDIVCDICDRHMKNRIHWVDSILIHFMQWKNRKITNNQPTIILGRYSWGDRLLPYPIYLVFATPKSSKIQTHFQTKTAQKLYPLEQHMLT